MVAGFMGVPLFSFVIPPVLKSLDPPAPTPEELAAGAEMTSTYFTDMAGYLGDLDVLLPSFVIGFIVAVVVSLVDKKGQAKLEGVKDDLRFARTGRD